MIHLSRSGQWVLLVLPVVLSSIVPKEVGVQNTKELHKLTQPSETILYKGKDEMEQRMVEVIYEKLNSGKDHIADCFIMGDKLVSKEFLSSFPPERIITLAKADLENIINECSTLLLSHLKDGKLHSFTTDIRGVLSRGAFDSLLIFPGTKWCGAGDVASDYEDVGVAEETDKCCREHDHCYDSIPAGKEKYDLKNKAIYTKSHCDCDRAFYSCLKSNSVQVSNTVGGLYFNFLQVQCFENNFPIKKCLDHSGWLPWIYWSCQKYELDTQKPKIWQFFDAKKY